MAMVVQAFQLPSKGRVATVQSNQKREPHDVSRSTPPVTDGQRWCSLPSTITWCCCLQDLYQRLARQALEFRELV